MSEETPGPDELAERGLAVLRTVEQVDELEGRLIEARFTGEEAAEAYLYVIMPTPENKLPKPVVGPTVDFKRLVVTLLNRTGATDLAISEEPPIIQDVVLPNGTMLVRAMTRAVDKKTGITKWAVKEEVRRSPHAATIALEKAEGKALESHPSYNRKLVNQKIKQFLRKLHLDPASFIIGGGGASAWGALFGRAKRAGVAPDEVRAAVRATVGKGLSEVATPEEVASAVAAVDERVKQSAADPSTPPAATPPAATPPAGQTEGSGSEMERIKSLTKALGMSNKQKAALWELTGGPGATDSDFRRTLLALEVMAAEGVPMDEAARRAREAIP